MKSFSNHFDRVRFWRVGSSDDVIVAKVLAGETRLFEVLMRRYNQRIYRAVRSLLKADSEVEEVMQQTYVEAFTHLRQLSKAASLRHWLVRIAVNECLTRLRQQSHFIALGLGIDRIGSSRSADDPEEAASRRERARLLEVALEQLPASYRIVFVLREIEGMSTRDTASAMGVSEDVVKTRLRRSKLSIRRQVTSDIYACRAGALAFAGSQCDRMVWSVLGRILPFSRGAHDGSSPERAAGA